MEKQKKTSTEAAKSGVLREAISQARIDEAQDIDRELDLRSSELARLEILEAGLESVFTEIPSHEDRFELTLVPSTPARLWIDMFSYVEMDAEAEFYRLVRNERTGRKVLVETSDVGVVRGRITEYVAQQIVARERQLAGFAEGSGPARRRRGRLRIGLVVSAFIIGVLTGVVGLFAVGWMITH